MAKRGARDPAAIRRELLALLDGYGREGADLREQVRNLGTAHERLNELGARLVSGRSARDRILSYFLRFPRQVVSGQELMVVAGISEYARRVRELRTEYGWYIVSGATAADERGLADGPGGDWPAMKPDEYMLMTPEQDREGATRWREANEIRKRRDLSVQDRILAFLKRNVGRPVSNEEIRYVAGDATEWARRVRELRTEQGWQVLTKATGREDLLVGQYVLETDEQLPEHDRRISDAERAAALDRDGHRCVGCGWSHARRSPSDPRKRLELHHIVHHAKGGSNRAENLVTLCNICHDRRHKDERRA